MKLRSIDGVAIDFGGTKTSVTRIKEGEVVVNKLVATNPYASATEHIETIAELLQFVKIIESEIVGIAVSGRVDYQGNWCAVNQGTLTKVASVPLADMLFARIGSNLKVYNDTFAAAIGEAHLGAGVGSESFGYVTVSTGVGGTCVINGQPLRSRNGLAGHAGFVTSRFGDSLCGSGRRGTVESIASGRTIAQAAEQLGYTGCSAKQVFEKHEQGHAWATALIKQSARAVGDLLASLAAIAGIDRAVIGGSIGLAKGYCDLLVEEIASEPNLFSPQVKPAALGPHSVAFGVLVAEQLRMRAGD